MEKVKETINKITHKDNHSTTTTHPTTTGTHNTHDGASGAYGTAGPHNSNMMNKADPRVDSDMDGGRNMGAAQYGPGGHHTTTGHNTAGGFTGSHDTAGPHNSNMMNKADPRVDSDMDGSRNYGATQYGTGSNFNNASQQGSTAGTGLGHSSATTTAGPHNSNMMNKMDPRVDSDMDGSRNMGAAQHGAGAYNSNTHNTGMTGTHNTGMTGTHNTGMTGAHNTHDTGIAGTHTGAHSNNPQSTNVGPHKSNLMNKLDPRVDSDMDDKKGLMK